MEHDARTFLGYGTPFLRSLARELLAPGLREHLGDLVVVLPGRRGGRKLLEHLVLASEGALEPPRIVTEAGLAQALARVPLPIASKVAVEWAWLEALASASREDVLRLAPRFPEDADAPTRLGLVRHALALERERAESSGAAQDPRATALERIGDAARRVLASTGRLDPAQSLERVRERSARRPRARVVLAGIVEIGPALRGLLASLDPPARVFVHGDPDDAAAFDAQGALIPAAWEARAIPLQERQWLAVEDAAEAVEESLAWLAELAPATALDDVALGVLGPELIAPLRRGVESHGLHLHVAAGESARSGAPWKALEALRAFAARGDFASLAELVRHPDVEAALAARVPPDAGAIDPPSELDRWHAEDLPDSLQGELAGTEAVTRAPRTWLGAARALAAHWLGGERRPLAAWVEAWRSWTCAVHPWIPADEGPESTRDAACLGAFAMLAQELESLTALAPGRALTAVEALELLLSWSSEPDLQAERREPSLETLGWLELALEEAPRLLILGCNDGWVPQNDAAPRWDAGEGSESADARRRARVARDVHALTAILRSRASDGDVRLLALRHGVQGDPLKPSRLLFHAPDEVAIARARSFFGDGGERALPEPDTAASVVDRAMPVPVAPPVTSMSVSSFKAYLESPYLYYLRQVLRLERVRDDAWELDPAFYGELAHAVLRDWGNGELRHSADARRIEAFVLARLGELARERFGGRPLPAVRLQLQQLERRLRAFAQAQALEADAGWRVEDVEFPLQQAELDVDGVPMRVTGIVDRLDRHARSGAWRVLDYKTGDAGHEPVKAHRGRAGFKDLQLFLYRHFLAPRFAGAPADVGYFALTRKLAQTGVAIAVFGPGEQERALEEARRVVREVRTGEFRKLGRARPADRVEQALCGLLLLDSEDHEALLLEGAEETASEEGGVA